MVSIAALLAALSCSGGIVCGEGTVERGGECRSTTPADTAAAPVDSDPVDVIGDDTAAETTDMSFLGPNLLFTAD
jgi:hypothetical protein